MVGVAVGAGRDQLLKALQRERILAIPAGHDVVRFLPPFIVSDRELGAAVDAWGRIPTAS